MLAQSTTIWIIAWAVLHCASPLPDPPINLIIINVQQLGWGDVGLYVPWRHDTPAIDQLATSGITLDGLYAETSATASLGALLSGRLAVSWGLYSSNNAEATQLHEDSGFSMPESVDLLPQILAKESYSTKFIGRWNLGQRTEANPMNYGFDSFLGTVSDLGSEYDDLQYPNVGFYRNKNIVARMYDSSSSDTGLIENGVSSLTKLYTDAAEVFINTRESKPFYLHISLDALVHTPYRSQSFVNSSSDSRATSFTDALKEVDNLVGVLTDTLKNNGLSDNTLVVFSADSTALASHYVAGSNGPFSGETGDTTEGGIRVPALLSFPGYDFQGQTRSDQVMNLADLHATILSLMGLESEECEELMCVTGGMDMTDSLTTGESTDRIVAIYRGRSLMAIRMGRYKAHRMSHSAFVPGQFLDTLTSYSLRNMSSYPILYDVVADPGERFFVGGGFASSSARYVEVMPDIMWQITYVLENIPMSGGLLNECDVAFREWSPPGCADLDLCLESPEGELEMCVIPEYSWG